MLLPTGLVHQEPPAGVPQLAAQVDLAAHATPAERNWQFGLDFTNSLKNDVVGDCVPVSALRAAQIRLAVSGRALWDPTDLDADVLYENWGNGYRPLDSSTWQVGTDVNNAMKRWCVDGVLVKPGLLDVVRWLKVDWTQPDHLKKAIDLVGPLCFSFALPRAIQGKAAWDFTPNRLDPATAAGSYALHRVCTAKFDPDGVYGITWGLEVPISWAFIEAYGVAADATPAWDWFETTGVMPSGLDWASLTQIQAQWATAT